MKKLLHLRCFFTLLLFLMVTALHAQWQDGLWTEKQAYNWYFGVYGGLNFEQAPPLPLTDSQIGNLAVYEIPNPVNPDILNNFEDLIYQFDYPVGSAVMSDPEGNLLFYTNGNTVWNKNHQVMVNGTDLISTPWLKENTIIIPAPGNSGRYFIFTIKSRGGLSISYPWPIEDPYYHPKVLYSEVDMSLDNGLGGITVNKNVVLAGDDEPTYSKITATYHSDGHQVWVMMHSIYNNDFKAYLVSESGVSMTPVVSSVGFSFNEYPDAVAQLKFSPDGTRIVNSIQLYSNQKNVEVFNFDKTTGKVTDVVVTLGQEEFINDGELLGIQGLEFSPNSKLLYTTGITSGMLKQFNLEAGDEAAIKASGITLSNFSDPMQFNTFMQVAPDGKIYVAFSEYAYGGFGYPSSKSTINVINFPNNMGASCGFEPNAIDLGSDRSGHSFPSFIQDYFASGILHEGYCAKAPVTFKTLRISGITAITWDFGDPESGTDNVSTDMEPSHFFSSGGTYTVTAIITSNGAQQTATAVVVILPAPDAALPPLNVLAKCADNIGNATFNLTELNTYILEDQSETQFSVSYYASQEDLVANAAITAPNTFITAGQIIYAKVTNTVTGCTTMIEFSLVVNPLPVAGNPAQNMELCGNTSATAVFNLTEQTSTILDGQDPAEFNVIYYTDAGLTNQIQQPEAFESGGQTIYATVINKATGCTALAVPEFDIIVVPLPTLPEITTFDGCSPFDLVTIFGEPEAGTVFSFHSSEEDALDNIHVIANADKYIVEGNTGSLYVRATNSEGCVQVGELLLKPGNCFIPRGISPNNDGKNDTFDLSGFDVKVLKIFNRYGKEVYSKSNYTNEWTGKSNKGDELPSGTYYYMIESGDGESKTGWVYINR